MHNWHEEVKEYKRQYQDGRGTAAYGDEYIYEYIDSLVPIYYGDILRVFNDLQGPSMTFVIGADDVGRPVYNLMQKIIFDEFLEEFMAHWTEEEE